MNVYQDKLNKLHQSNEWTRTHKGESICFECLNRDVCFATTMTVCFDCIRKRGTEPLLAYACTKFYGYCDVCARYKFRLTYLNVRLCRRCYARTVVKSARKNRGELSDPFWAKMRKKYGKDYRQILGGL